MKRYFSTKTLIGLSVFATLLLFAFSGSHPTIGANGYTGAPNDSVCTVCHSQNGSLEGTLEFTGLPTVVEPNTTYPLTVTITNTNGGADRAGFQMVSLKANLANGGSFSVPAIETNAQVKTPGGVTGKSYVGHQNAKTFTGNQVIYNVDWTSPESSDGDITVYAAAMVANGTNGNNGDKFLAINQVVQLNGGGGDPLTGSFSNVADASCSDTNDGSATINAMGGSGNYTYAWDNGETNATAVMLSPGSHDVTVTDDSGDMIVESVTINAPPILTTAIVFQEDATCNGTSTGTAELTATGGTPNYLFDWGNGITGPIQANLFAGNYIVTITDANNCTSFENVLITEPPAIQINIVILDEPGCNGESTGMISVIATGGTGAFIYNWLDGIGIPTEGTLSMIPAGDYQVEVIDGLECIATTTITLGEPEETTSSITSTDVLCFGGNDGSATASGQGGSGNFTFAWSNGGSGATQNELTAGTYDVTVSDNDNCTSVSSVTIGEPDSEVIAGISVVNQPNCGNQDGELSAFATGGSPDYSYLWNTDDTSPVLTNLSSGIYIVTVTDNNGCTSENAVTLTDNDGVTLAANNVINNTCNNGMEGAATISASGGAGMYTYAWSNGGTNETETNLIAGSYTITVTDEGNCTGEIMIEITEPMAIATNETLIDIDCNGAETGSIQLNATGGTGDLMYQWNTGDTEDNINELIPGIFTVTITDANDCEEIFDFAIAEPDAIEVGMITENPPSCAGDMDGSIGIEPTGGTGDLSYLWSNGDTGPITTNLGSGDYSVSITDENSCEQVFDFTLEGATALALTSSSISPTCDDSSDGSATLSIIGGTGDYNIEWSTGDMTITIIDQEAGTYTVTVTDENGCTNDAQVIITAPLSIDPNITTTNESSNGANDGTATSDPQNGTAPFTFVWENGEDTPTIDNLAPGTYGVTITDANDCTAEGSAIVNSGDCDITSEVDIQDISCFNFLDGAISVELMGAVEPVSYSWSNGETSPGLTNLGVGVYSVTITDANACQLQILDLEITEPEDIIASDATVKDATTSTSTDGSIEVEFSGGTGDLTIDYTDGDGMDIGITSFDGLQSGTYGVNVTDENGCFRFFGPYSVGVLSSLDDINAIKARVYPNPAQSFFVIETETQLTSTPSVYSVTGQLINTSLEQIGNEFTIDTENLDNGVYYIKLSSNSDVILKRVIVAK